MAILPAREAAASDESPFGGKNAPRKERDVHWLKPELVAEIEFAGWTSDGNVRQAAFKGLRQDKDAREVRAEMPAMTNVAQPAAAKAAVRSKAAVKSGKPAPRAKAAEMKASEVMGVVISHPDKAMWPDAGDGEKVTKL